MGWAGWVQLDSNCLQFCIQILKENLGYFKKKVNGLYSNDIISKKNCKVTHRGSVPPESMSRSVSCSKTEIFLAFFGHGPPAATSQNWVLFVFTFALLTVRPGPGSQNGRISPWGLADAGGGDGESLTWMAGLAACWNNSIKMPRLPKKRNYWYHWQKGGAVGNQFRLKIDGDF